MPRAKAQPNAAPHRGARAKLTKKPIEERPVWTWPGLGVPAEPVEVQEIPLDSIWKSSDQRALNLKRVQLITKTIKVDDLLQPIVVALKMSPKGMKGGRRPYQLLDGGHRVEAFRQLGRKTIIARVLPQCAYANEIQRLKVVGNLARAELSREERDEALRQYHASLKSARGGRGILALKGARGGYQPNNKGVSQIARVTGYSRRTVERALQSGHLKSDSSNKELLGRALRWLNDALATKGIVQEMTHYRFQGGEIRATNGRITAGCPVDYAGAFLVPGKELRKLVGLMRATPTIAQGSTPYELVIKAGRICGTIQTLPLDQWDYPGVDDASWQPMPDGLLDIVSALRPFISDNATQAWAMGVALESGWCCATNGVVIAGAPCEGLGNDSAILPVWAIDFAIPRREGLIQWSWSSDYVAFRWEDGRWMRSSLIDGTFHERAAELIRDAVDEKPTQVITKELRNALDHACEISDAESSVRIYADRVLAEFGKAHVEEQIESEVPEESDCSIWSAQYLALVLRHATRWQPSRWPKDTPFAGDLIVGYMKGRNR